MSVLKHEINRMEEAIGRQLSLRRRFNRLIAHHLSANNALQGGAGCTPSKRSKYHKLSRKSPPIPANECEAGIVKTGNDGRKYVAKPNKNNVNRWVLVNPAKKPRKRRKQQHKPAQTDKDGWISRPRKTPAAPVPRRPQMKRKKGPPFVLPADWTTQIKVRTTGKSAGRKDTLYVSPSGRQFRSQTAVAKFLADSSSSNLPPT